MISAQGRNLSILLLAGLLFSMVGLGVELSGIPLTLLLVQLNVAVYHGAVWQLFTSVFVVVPFSGAGPLGIIDVLFNAVAIIWLDGLLSHSVSESDYYTLFLLSAVAGNVASLYNGPDAASFGASGGIFGLLAGAVAKDFTIERRVNYSMLVWFLAVFVLSSFMLSYVDWLSHLGGAASGLVAGYALGKSRGVEAL